MGISLPKDELEGIRVGKYAFAMYYSHIDTPITRYMSPEEKDRMRSFMFLTALFAGAYHPDELKGNK